MQNFEIARKERLIQPNIHINANKSIAIFQKIPNKVKKLIKKSKIQIAAKLILSACFCHPRLVVLWYFRKFFA